MATAGRLQKKKKKVACSYNAYHSQTERELHWQEPKESERKTTFSSTANTAGDPDLCMPSFIYIKKKILTAISFHVPVPRVCVLTGEMSPRHKHVACCELGDKHISELHPRAWWLLPQRPWQLARHTATSPQTDPSIKYHLYNTKHTSVLSEIKKTDGWNCIIVQQTVTNLIPF